MRKLFISNSLRGALVELIVIDYFLGSNNLSDEFRLQFFFVNGVCLDFSKYIYYL